MRKGAVILLAAVLFSTTNILGATLRVPTEYTTIQEAIDFASEGDTILVESGAYEAIPPSQYVAHFVDKTGVTLLSESGKESTVIDALGIQYYAPLRFFNSNNCIVKGFTLTNGHSNVYVYESTGIVISDCDISYAYDHGIVTGDGTHVELELINNRFFGNRLNAFYSEYVELAVSFNGNAIFENGKGIEITTNTFISFSIINNHIFNNTSHGIQFYKTPSSLSIIGNTIYDNGGSGIAIAGLASPLVQNNTIVNNSHSGIEVGSNMSPTVQNNIIVSNQEFGIIVYAGAMPEIVCNDVWNNNSNYGGSILDQTGINGNISEIPLFCNPESDDYSLASNSPAFLQTCGIMGAILEPGCEPIAAQKISWSNIKSIYK